MAGLIHADPGLSLSHPEYVGIASHTITSGVVGDMLYFDGSEVARLPATTNGFVLMLSAGVPTWTSLGSVPISGNLDMAGNLILNIGANGTDFTAGGGLNLAQGLAVAAGGVVVTTGGLSVLASGISVTGNSTITGTLGGLTGLTVASGGAAISGNSTITGTLGGLTGLTVASGGAAISGNSTITGTLSGITTLTVTTIAATAFSGTLDMATNIITNIGNAGTDFLSNGGLTLANAFTVTTGGATITAGGATVTTGNLGIGGAPTTSSGIVVTGTSITAGTDTVSINIGATQPSTATSSMTGISLGLTTTAAAYTTGNVLMLDVKNPTKGGGHTITTLYGVYVRGQTAGGTNNYGVYIEAPSGGAANNIGLYNAGTTTLVGVTLHGAATSPSTIDGAALGTTALQWSDLFLASGGVINWNNGDASLTHTTTGNSVLTFAGTAVNIALIGDPGGGQTTFSVNSRVMANNVPMTDFTAVHATGTGGMIGVRIFHSQTTSNAGATNFGLVLDYTHGATVVANTYAHIAVNPPTFSGTSVGNIYGIFVNNQGNAVVTGTALGVAVAAQSGAVSNIGYLYGAVPGSGTYAFYNSTTSATYLGGATTINAGGLTITTGNLGVGQTANTTIGVFVRGALLSGGTTQWSHLADATSNSSATTSAGGGYFAGATAAVAFTATNVYALYAGTATKGAGSTHTTATGMYIQAQTTGGTNNYGIYIEAPSGGATNNIGLYNAGTTTLVGAVTFGSTLTFTNSLIMSGGFDATTSTGVLAGGTVGAQVVPTFTRTNNGDLNGFYVQPAFTSGGTMASGNFWGIQCHFGSLTVAVTTTVTRAANIYASGPVATVNGTLSNNNSLYLGTPSGGTTVRVIDSAAGGYLTTGGIWTDNPSWAEIKKDISSVGAIERAELFNWFRDEYKPVRYRYSTAHDAEGRVTRYEDSKTINPHFGYLLDDMPENIREIVCADASGGISGKDERGLLLALMQEAGQRIAALERN